VTKLTQAERAGGVGERVLDAVDGAGRGPSVRKRIGDAVHDVEREGVAVGADVLTKTKTPELHRYWTTRDRAATRRLFQLAAEILQAVEGVFPPRPGW
jgi:hypothetical protein